MMADTMLVAVLFAVVFISVQCTMLGGYEPRDVNDEHIQAYADFAVSQLNSAMNNLFYMKKKKVLEASSQVVAGMNYYLKIELSPTVCTKTDKSVIDLESCEENNDEMPQICEVHVWVKPGMKEMEMTDYKCNVVKN